MTLLDTPTTGEDDLDGVGLDRRHLETAPDSATSASATSDSAPDVTPAFDHVDLEAFAAEIDELREAILNSLGKKDAAYIRRIIKIQRSLDAGGRLALLAGIFPPAWFAGVGMLSLAKILENMEIGHNVLHGQWDWMRDPEIHSTNWEWDHACPSSQWKHSHNYRHHMWTNVAGKDHDIGYGALRVDESTEWHKDNLLQPVIFVVLALLFDLGISTHDNEHLDVQHPRRTDYDKAGPKLRESWEKIKSQFKKDFVYFPLLAAPLGAPSVVAAASGTLAANVIRNVWSFVVIFCGHFPDGVRIFSEQEIEGESKGGWYARQVEGSANFEGGPLMNIMTGNLDHQIEHHLYPDMPSNRYAEAAPKIKEICERHGVKYNTGSFAHQAFTVLRKIVRLTFP